MPSAILLEDVESLGSKGAVVDVATGYLRNYLIPRKLAAPATKGSLAAAAAAVAARERAQEHAAAESGQLAELLAKTTLTIARQAGEDGRLFGSVTNADIAEAIREARGVEVDRRKIALEEPIKHVGTHVVELELEGGVAASVKTMVVAQ
jgi:large subunit ribosomal protein L9